MPPGSHMIHAEGSAPRYLVFYDHGDGYVSNRSSPKVSSLQWVCHCICAYIGTVHGIKCFYERDNRFDSFLRHRVSHSRVCFGLCFGLLFACSEWWSRCLCVPAQCTTNVTVGPTPAVCCLGSVEGRGRPPPSLGCPLQSPAVKSNKRGRIVPGIRTPPPLSPPPRRNLVCG